MQRAEPDLATSASALAGTYHCADLLLDCRIAAEGNQLMLYRAGRSVGALQRQQETPDTFAVGTWRLAFARGAPGAGASFTLDAGRARGLLFVRR